MRASDILSIATSQLGVTEYPAESNNVSYNTWYYGKPVKGSYPWCVVFCQWCFSQAGSPLPIRTASCTTLMTYAKKHGCWFDDPKQLQPGDLFIMQTSSGKHIGIVEKVIEPGQYWTIEGNTSLTSDDNGGAVMRMSRSVKRHTILGAYRPGYEEEMTEEEIRAIIRDELAKIEERRKNDLPAAWSLEDRKWAEEAGIISGTGDKMAYKDYTTREQMCAFLHRLVKLIK